MKCEYEGCNKKAIKWVLGFGKVVGLCAKHHKEILGQ